MRTLDRIDLCPSSLLVGGTSKFRSKNNSYWRLSSLGAIRCLKTGMVPMWVLNRLLMSLRQPFGFMMILGFAGVGFLTHVVAIRVRLPWPEFRARPIDAAVSLFGGLV